MKKFLISLLFLLSFCSLLFAQEEVRTLTVEEAVNLALQNNIDIKNNKIDLEDLALKEKYSWNSASPSLNSSVGFSGGSSDWAKVGYSVEAGIVLSLTPALATSMKAAALAYEAGKTTLEATKRSVELNVRRTFYSLVYFNENLETQEKNLETLKQTYEANKSKYNQGRLSELNLLQSQYNYESKLPAIENLKTTYNSNLDNFKLILGLNLSDKIELSGSLDDFANVQIDESVLAVDIESLPSITSLKQSIAAAENNLESTKYTTYRPSVTLSLTDNLSGSSKDTEDFAGKVTQKAWVPKNSFSYRLSVSIPLDGYLPWSNKSITLQTQMSGIKKSELSLEQKKSSIALTIQNGYNTILQAQTQLKLLEKSVELSQKTYDATKKAYNMGSTDLLSLQTAENNLYTAKYNVQNQKYTIISAILDLENTLGLPFGELGNKLGE